MNKNNEKYNAYIQILSDELQVALGCTEPNALAYCACILKEQLGEIPEFCKVTVCGNIIKNAKSVIVPNTDKLKGIECSVAAGFFASCSQDKLQVLGSVTQKDTPQIKAYATSGKITVEKSDCNKTLYIDICGQANGKSARVVIEDSHTNVVLIQKDGAEVYRQNVERETEKSQEQYALLNLQDIFDFANTVDLQCVREIIERQIRYNSAISAEGLRGNYGAQVGKVLLSQGKDVLTRAQAAAAAGSDARMSGCDLPVVIVSGSGNQGMTASLPVLEYAKEVGATKDDTIRALVLSNLITIHQKTGIGKLSAFCGAVSAGAGASCGIAYLLGGDVDVVTHTLINALAITSGLVCDGAKPSCAGKIATAVYGGLLGYNMYKHGQQFFAGDGIITKGAENTIANVSRLAKKGMSQTDKEILDIMTECKHDDK